MLRFSKLVLVILTAFLWVACVGTESSSTAACADVTCEEAQSCVDGACVADETGESDDTSETGDATDTEQTDPEPDDESDTPDQPDPEPEATGAPCESDGDCAEALFCEDAQCVAPRNETCSPEVPCAAGFDCISTAGGASCMEPCEETADCRVSERCWAQGEGSLLGDLGGYCFLNLCGPPDNFGILQAADFLGSCNALGTDDGICFGPVSETQLGPIGICMNASGSVEPGQTCEGTALHGDTEAICNNGFCTPADICLNFCDTTDDTCEPLPDGTATTCTLATPTEGATAGVCQPEPGDDDGEVSESSE
jgi:hypothetical protein